MLRFILVAILLLPLPFIHTSAQPNPGGNIDRTIEAVLENEEGEESEDQQLLQELDEYRRRPIDLSTATSDELSRLPLISFNDAVVILDFIDEHEPTDILQLDSIPSLDAEQLLVLRTYTVLRRPERRTFSDRFSVLLRSRLIHEMQERRGFRDSLLRTTILRDGTNGDSLGTASINLGPGYLGSPEGILTRLDMSWRNYSAGMTFEKDAGEPFFLNDTLDYLYTSGEQIVESASPPTVDPRFGAFASRYVAAQYEPASVVLGDYSLEFGQGLLFWSGYGGTKGSATTDAPFKSPRGVTPYRSSAEIEFMRGAAVTLHERGWLPKGLTASFFISKRSLDATIESDDTGADPVVTTIRSDGYRRTHSELRRSGNLDEALIGANVHHRFRGGTIGLTGYTSGYSTPIAGRLASDFSGDRVTMVSIDTRYSFGRSTALAEVARSTSGAFAALGGIETGIGTTDLVVAGRYVPANFHTPHGRGFGESPARQKNEAGLYIGLKTKPLKRLTLTSYIDFYHHPERTVTTPFPTSGVDALLRLDYVHSPRFRLSCQLRSERSGDAVAGTDDLDRAHTYAVERTVSSGRIEMEYTSVGERFRVRTRLERRVVAYDALAPTASGWLSYLDLRLQPLRPLSIAARISLFDTDDFASAIHEFEQDLPGRTTNLSLSGEGHRLYLYARWRPIESLALAVKYAATVYTDRTAISPGTPREITGPMSSSVAVQVDLTL